MEKFLTMRRQIAEVTLNFGLAASKETLNMVFHLNVVSTVMYVKSLVADVPISHWKSILN